MYNYIFSLRCLYHIYILNLMRFVIIATYQYRICEAHWYMIHYLLNCHLCFSQLLIISSLEAIIKGWLVKHCEIRKELVPPPADVNFYIDRTDTILRKIKWIPFAGNVRVNCNYIYIYEWLRIYISIVLSNLTQFVP